MSTERAPNTLHLIALESSEILLIGLSHKQTVVSLREKFAISVEQHQQLITELLHTSGIAELVLLSTCNRVEIVIGTRLRTDQAREEILSAVVAVLERVASLDRADFQNAIYILSGSEAVEHLFKVACGLDSMVLGETQILGQLKSAFEVSQSAGATGTLLNRLYHRAFAAAKLVRSSTRIGHHPVSVCYAAKKLAENIFGDLSNATVMLIGAGEVGALAAKHFCASGVNKVFIVNRSLQRAVPLAEKFNGVPLSLTSLSDFLYEADIVIGASAGANAQEVLVDIAIARDALQRRRRRPMFFIDLAVPRNFDSKIDSEEDAFLYNVDDLQGVVEQNKSFREAEVSQAELLLQDEVEKFSAWLDVRSLAPEIKEVKRLCDDFQQAELRKTVKTLEKNGFTPQQIDTLQPFLQSFSAALLAKTLHKPFSKLKAEGVVSPELRSAFKKLFLE